MNKRYLVSLGLNAVLVAACGILLIRSGGPSIPESHSQTIASISSPAAEPTTAQSSADEMTSSAHLPPSRSLAEMDYEEQVAALVVAGWSVEDAKVYALGHVMREGMRLMMPGQEGAENEYWKQQMGPNMDWENQSKMMEMQHRMQAVMEDLFGDEVAGMFGSHVLPFSSEKTSAVRMIQLDYQMMQGKIHQDTGGIMLPEDFQALELLEEEMRGDLAAILSPEELFEYEIRTSSTSGSLRFQLRGMEPTEDEFRTIFRLQHEVDQLGGSRHNRADEESQRRQAEAQERVETELKDVLGEDRYRQYQRNQDHGYGQLVNVAKRLDLPEERVDQVYDLKEFTEEQQQEIHQNSELSNEERQAALKTLGDETRKDLTEFLGEQGVELYKQHGGYWMHRLPE